MPWSKFKQPNRTLTFYTVEWYRNHVHPFLTIEEAQYYKNYIMTVKQVDFVHIYKIERELL